MKKGIHKATGENIIIVEVLEDYCEILLDGEYKTVAKDEIEVVSSAVEISTLGDLTENIFISCIRKPLSDILYSHATNRLTPEPHQYKPLIKFLNSENNRVLIADEVGLGKTIEAGMIYKEIDNREELKISLVVVPSSLTHKWQEEFTIRFDEYFAIYKTNQFLNFIDEVEQYSTSKLIHEKIIISYHTLRDERVIERLKNSFFEIDFLIMDEAHTMRNAGTATYDSAEVITSLAEHIVFLTATPVQNALEDLFNILSLLERDYFKDYDYFQKMIAPNPLIHKLIAQIRNHTPLDEIKALIRRDSQTSYPTFLNTILHDILSLDAIDTVKKVTLIDDLTKADRLSFIINRTKKKDVGLSTPRQASSVVVDITEAERAYYDAVIDFVKFLNPETPQGFITIMPERMASSSMIASLESFKMVKQSGKLFIKDMDDLEEYHEDLNIRQEAMQYLDRIIEKGNAIGEYDSKFLKLDEILQDLQSQNIQQMIVFSFFKKTLDHLEERLQVRGYRVGKIHGDFSTEERFATIKRFKKGVFDILLSSEVGSEGLDMQFCNVVINYDLPWNPMRVEQRIGRIDRIGQKHDKLHIVNLCITDSIEDRILNRLYSKLNIFENAIGELEPILGELERELNFAELIHLSQAEIDEKLNMEKLALERKRLEISRHTQEFDKMLNEDLNYGEQKESLLDPLKVQTLQSYSKQMVIDYLKENRVNFVELKEGTLKLSSENLKQFFNLLKRNMSDKRTEALQHKQEKDILRKIHRLKELKISFSLNENDDFQTLYLYLNSPIMSIITRDKKHKTVYTVASHDKYHGCHAIIYRADFEQHKPKSYLKTIVLDRAFGLIDEVDYFDFIHGCRMTDAEIETDFVSIKAKATPHIIKSVERQKQIEADNQNRQIDVKIESIKSYFQKQIAKARRLEASIDHEDVKRMRMGEIVNLEKQRDRKIGELEKRKMIGGSFEILGIVGIV